MNGGAVQLLDDGDGNREAKSASGVITRYLVDDLNPTGYPQVVDELTSGAVTRTYTYGLQRISQDQVISNTWTPSFYSYDGAGSVRALTNTAGATTDSYEYDAFGNSFTVSGTTPNEMMYRGEQYDSDLGLYYLRARYYNPTTGRFMSRDPGKGWLSAPFTLHKYLYAAANPIYWRDPSGRDIIEDALIISNRSLGAKEYLNTIGCVASIGFAAAASELDAWGTTGVISAAYGCVSSYIWPGGNIALTLKTTLDFGACAAGLAQVAKDITQEALQGSVSNEAFYTDAIGGVLGCAVTHLGRVLGGG